MEKRLGRGLGSLLAGSELAASGSVEVDVQSIRPNPFQPRRSFDTEALEELRDSIRQHGVLQPLVVRPREDHYELIAGERRWRASRLAGRTTVPAIIKQDVGDEAMLELALVENVQRQDLDPLERARAFRQLQSLLGLTQEQVADRVGLKRPSVANLCRLLDLPQSIQDLVSQGRLTMGHARALLGLEEASAQLRLAEDVLKHEMSVREVEATVRAGRSRREVPMRPAEPVVEVRPVPPWQREMEDRLRESLGTRVKIQNGPDFRGQIVIEFYERADLERLYAVLSPRVQI